MRTGLYHIKSLKRNQSKKIIFKGFTIEWTKFYRYTYYNSDLDTAQLISKTFKTTIWHSGPFRLSQKYLTMHELLRNTQYRPQFLVMCLSLTPATPAGTEMFSLPCRLCLHAVSSFKH
eukprot:c16629_g1_i1 orf=127-480(+)